MDIAIITCTPDPAGMNIKQHLLKKGFTETDESFDNNKVYKKEFKDAKVKLFTAEKASIYNENIDKDITKNNFTPELIIFATTHKSASGIHSLSVHSPGNWSKAELGGSDNQLCIAPARILKFALLDLEQQAKERDLDYDIIQECTHHGPYTEIPTMFIEIGSDESSWSNQDAGDAISDTILHILNNIGNIPEYPTAFGIGGPHHTPAFTKVMHRTDYAVGHVCPKYMLESLTKTLIEQAIEKTIPRPGLIILDWKGLGTEKERIKIILDNLNLKYERSHSLKEPHS